MFEVKPPRARDWAAPLSAAVILFLLSRTRGDVWSLVLAGLSVVGAIWAIVNFVIHVTDALHKMRREDRELEYRFTENHRAEILSKMSNDQLRTYARSGRPLISVIPTPKGPVERIDGEPVFLFTAWYMLRMSNGARVYPINNFKQETYHFDMLGLGEWDDYTQAKAFTQYLCLYGAAEWGVGNTSATWRKGFDPEKVMAALGLTKDSYDVPELA